MRTASTTFAPICSIFSACRQVTVYHTLSKGIFKDVRRQLFAGCSVLL